MFKSQYQTNNSLNLPKREELLCNDEWLVYLSVAKYASMGEVFHSQLLHV